jgi:hypothetical protein
MSQAVIGGLIGAVGASAVVKRVKEIRMYYADSGEHDVLVAVCVSSSCMVDHVDVDGTIHENVSLSSNDLILGGKVVIKSGRMFVMSAVYAGAL